MKMVGVEGSGRRLPQWMLGISASDQVEKSDNVKPKEKPVEEGVSSQASTPGLKSKKRSLCGKENLLERPHVLAKCTTKRRKLKEKPLDVDSDIDLSIDAPEKKCNRTGRKVSKSIPRKRRKTKDYRSSDEEFDIQPLSEDEEVELTVEDLMTIAKELVGGDKDTDQDRTSKKMFEQGKKSPTTMSSRNESIDHGNAQACDQTKTMRDVSVSYNETKAAHEVSSFKKSENSSTEEIVININRTGDPAQDMLDLFLGPLLKKPVDEKKKDFVMSDSDFSQQFGIQSKTNIVREETAPSMKKKSSLKDKIAMFLD